MLPTDPTFSEKIKRKDGIGTRNLDGTSQMIYHTYGQSNGGKMKGPKEKPVLKLVGEDGNAFAILGRVRKALKEAGSDSEYIEKFTEEAESGDYDNLLRTVMKYVIVR